MMDWTEKERCVLCSRGGNLLVCSDDGCPISVHKNCMGCKARFDDVGRFYCPYCHYRRLTAETRQLRDKAILAKKALSTFLDEEMRDGNHREPKTGIANEQEHILSRDKTCLDSKNDLVSDDGQNQSTHLEEHQQSKPPLPCEENSGHYNGSTCRIMVVYEAHSRPGVACGDEMISDPLESDACTRVGVKDRTESAKYEVADDQQHATSTEKELQSNNAVNSSTIEKHITHQKRNHSQAFNKNGNRRKEECMMEHASKTFVSLPPGLQLQSKSNTEISNDDLDSHTFSKQQRHSRHRPTRVLDPPHGATKGSLEAAMGAVSCPATNTSNAGEHNDSSTQLTVYDRNAKLPSLNGKRRVRWSGEEEDMLMIGVRKFSLTMHKNLPWKKILEYGRHVFDASRTPSDLKDKWRHMAK